MNSLRQSSSSPTRGLRAPQEQSPAHPQPGLSSSHGCSGCTGDLYLPHLLPPPPSQSPFCRNRTGARSPGNPCVMMSQGPCQHSANTPPLMSPTWSNGFPLKQQIPLIGFAIVHPCPSMRHGVHGLTQAAAARSAPGWDKAGTRTCSGYISFLQFKARFRHLTASFFPLQFSLADEVANYRPAAAIWSGSGAGLRPGTGGRYLSAGSGVEARPWGFGGSQPRGATTHLGDQTLWI